MKVIILKGFDSKNLKKCTFKDEAMVFQKGKEIRCTFLRINTVRIRIMACIGCQNLITKKYGKYS